jgi:acetoacetyl-CoA reductase
MSRIAIVTGGTRGIGAAISIALQAAGCKVAAVYASNDAVANTFHEKTSIPIYRWDVTDFDACANGVQKVREDLGPIGILVNNAGITRDCMFHKMTVDHWDAVINTNLSSLFNMCRPVIEEMRDLQFGRIINISSINAQKGQLGQTNYSAAKAGEIGFSKALAQENASRGITVNVVCPGYIKTEMIMAMNQDVVDKRIIPNILVGRLGEPHEIARCVSFLASEDAGFITGSTLTANGGQYMV